jgi:N-acetylneuraminic acid mutarotase
MISASWRRWWRIFSSNRHDAPQSPPARRSSRLQLEELEARLAPASWSPIALMTQARFGHAATLLGNGEVLVEGGYFDTTLNVLASAELYNPSANAWAAAAPMAAGRYGQTATLLQNGKVLVTGGENSNFVAYSHGTIDALASAELYDPATNTWSAAASMSVARWGHTATLLASRQVLVVGGFNLTSGDLASAELYDPATNTWSAAGSMAGAREIHRATLLSDGRVLVTGGLNTHGDLASAEIYDPAANTWSSAGSMAAAREWHTATLLNNGRVLVAGGYETSIGAGLASAELYDPVANTWSAAASLLELRWGEPATLLGNGRVLVEGGLFDNAGGVRLSAEVYDPVHDAWTLSAPLTAARYGQTATLLTDGRVLVDGGVNALSGPLSEAEIYQPDVPGAVTHFQVVVAANALAGAPVGCAVTALDANNLTATGYTGTIHFTSTDSAASLPMDATLTNGTGTFTVTMGTLGGQTIAVSDTASPGITGVSSIITVTPAATRFVLSAPDHVTAGAPFVATITAEDANGNTASAYAGVVHFTSTDSQAILPADATLTNGVGSFLVTLKTAAGSPWTVTAQDTVNATLTGTSGNITVNPDVASYFTVGVPSGTVTTGAPFNIAVTALDQFGNTATGYSGVVHFTSSDPNAQLPPDATLTGGLGTFSVTLRTAGGQTVTATGTNAAGPTLTGTSTAVNVRGLIVTSFTPTATGFTASFSKPFDPSVLTLYGSGVGTVSDVTLVGNVSGPISGTLLVDPSNMSVTFNATGNFLSSFLSAAVLPNDTYTATLVSGSAANGFVDGLGAGLDGGNNGGHANYVAQFTTTNQAEPVLSIPDFARGPDDTHNVQIPNDTGHGIPITLASGANVQDVAFTLSYNPSLLNVASGTADDATGSGTKTFTLVGPPTIIDATHATASFHYTNDTPQTGNLVLGDVIATVPSSAGALYKAKELLTLSAVTINGSAFTGVTAPGVHVNAYFGDVTGNGPIDGLDVATANGLAQGKSTGFEAFPLLDPVVVGDVAGDISVDAGDVSTLAAFVSQLPTPKIPALPTGISITPSGPDPVLSLVEPGGVRPRRLRRGEIVVAGVRLVDPPPIGSTGSTGITEAILALTYDPSVLRISAAEITLGLLPNAGQDWQISALVDAAAGQIAVTLYGTTPIPADQAGNLVNFHFHALPGAAASSSVRLVSSVTLGGQRYVTQVDDAQGQLAWSSGVDRLDFATDAGQGGRNRQIPRAMAGALAGVNQPRRARLITV